MTPALSLTGSVFGMHATAVNPPATADAVPVATVSLCSCPGSRRCTCMSMKPGTDHEARAGSRRPRRRRRATPADRGRPATMRSPSISTSNVPSTPAAGIDDAPPLSSRFMFRSSREQIQHGHAHGDAVRDLIENHRERAVGHLRRDLDAAIHRPRDA